MSGTLACHAKTVAGYATAMHERIVFVRETYPCPPPFVAFG